MNESKTCCRRLLLPTLIAACTILFSLNGVAQTVGEPACITVLQGGDFSDLARVQWPQPGTGNGIELPGNLCLTNLTAEGHRIFLRYSADGTLKLFDNTANGEMIWCAHAADGSCASGNALIFHNDGNLSLNTSPSQEVWSAKTQGANNGSEFLKVTPDAHACVVTVSNGGEAQPFCSNNTEE